MAGRNAGREMGQEMGACLLRPRSPCFSSYSRTFSRTLSQLRLDGEDRPRSLSLSLSLSRSLSLSLSRSRSRSRSLRSLLRLRSLSLLCRAYTPTTLRLTRESFRRSETRIKSGGDLQSGCGFGPVRSGPPALSRAPCPSCGWKASAAPSHAGLCHGRGLCRGLCRDLCPCSTKGLSST